MIRSSPTSSVSHGYDTKVEYPARRCGHTKQIKKWLLVTFQLNAIQHWPERLNAQVQVVIVDQVIGTDCDAGSDNKALLASSGPSGRLRRAAEMM